MARSSARRICGAAAFLLLAIASSLGVRSSPAVGRPGGRQRIAGAQNDSQLQNLGKFAVAQYNVKENASLVYVRVVSAEEQVVAGTMYYLVLQAAAPEKMPKLYEAKVWVRPWQNFKSLQGFKETPPSGARRHSDTVNPDGAFASTDGGMSMSLVALDDPIVKEAAMQALKTLQSRSNSLDTYELKEAVSAQAMLHKQSTSYNLMIIAQWGLKEERIEAEVVQSFNGAWTVKDVHLHQ